MGDFSQWLGSACCSTCHEVVCDEDCPDRLKNPNGYEGAESDTSSNARPDTAANGTNWPESAG